MNKATNNPGIDYGLGRTNINTETGIRFGVIPAHATFNCAEEVYNNGTDLDYEDYIGELKGKLANALTDYFSDHKHEGKEQSKLDEMVEAAFDAISDNIGDHYESTGDCTRTLYKENGYVIESASDCDLWVQQSPYYTYAQFCSPCAPGACYLTTPIELSRDANDHPLNPPTANKCYCLGHDWFEDSKAPYPVFSVETDKELISREVESACTYCAGTGRRTVAQLATSRGELFRKTLWAVTHGKVPVTDYNKKNKDFQCHVCNGKGKRTENQIEEKE